MGALECMTGLVLFIILVFVFPIFFALALARVTRLAATEAPAFVAYCAGIAAAVLSVVIDFLFRLIPHQPRLFYVLVLVAIIIGTSAAAIVMGRRRPPLPAPRNSSMTSRDARASLGPLEWTILIVVCATVVGLMASNLAAPLDGHDAIVHTMVAKILYRDLSAAGYPFATADPFTGFYYEGVHPLGFPASKILLMLLLGDGDTPWHKPLTGAYFGYLLIAVGTYAGRAFGWRHAAYAVLLLASVPLLLSSTLIVHIDPLRLYFFFLPFALLMEFIRSEHRSWLVAVALATALALHVHAGNAIILAYLVPIYFGLSAEPWRKRIGNALFVGATILLIAGWQYLQNIARTGTPLTTSYELGNLPALPLREWMLLRRSIDTPASALWNGALLPFTDFLGFGASIWFGTAGLLIAIMAVRKSRQFDVRMTIPAAVIILYSVLMCAALALHAVEFYQNPRYALVVAPFFSLLGSIFVINSMKLPDRVYRTLTKLPSPVYPIQWRLLFFFGARVFVASLITLTVLTPLWLYIPSRIASRSHAEFWRPENVASSDQQKIQAAIRNRDFSASGFVTLAAASGGIVPKTERILALRDSEIYLYGASYIVFELDMAMKEFYEAPSLQAAKQVLEKLGIRYIYVPYYTSEGMSSKYLSAIINDPASVSLIASDESLYLFRYTPAQTAESSKGVERASFHGEAKLDQRRYLYYPRGLSACEKLAQVHTRAEERIVAELVRGLEDIGVAAPEPEECRHMYDAPANWIPLPDTTRTLRLVAEFDGEGCAGLEIMFRTNDQDYRTRFFDYLATGATSEASVYAQPPPDADAFAIRVLGRCRTLPVLRSLRVEQLATSAILFAP